MAYASRATLLAFCRSLPHATEDIKWGNDLVFSVAKKMFAGFAADGREATFGCKVDPEEFDGITSLEGIRPAPYAARFHWISVDDPRTLSAADAKRLIARSYELVKAKLPAKVRRHLGDLDAAPVSRAKTAIKTRMMTKKKTTKTTKNKNENEKKSAR